MSFTKGSLIMGDKGGKKSKEKNQKQQAAKQKDEAQKKKNRAPKAAT